MEKEETSTAVTPEVMDFEGMSIEDMVYSQLVIASMERGLSEVEAKDWAWLVASGEKIRDRHKEEKIIEEERKRFLANGGNYQGKKKTKKQTLYAVSLEQPSLGVMKWILARNAGLSVKEAGKISDVTWSDVVNECGRNEEVRNAREGMLANSRQLVRELAYGVAVDSLKGKGIEASTKSMAQWALERVDVRGDFARPGSEDDSHSFSGEGGKGGGIVINLIGDAAGKVAMKPTSDGKAKVFADI